MTFFHIFAMLARAQVHDVATMTRSNRCLLKFYLRNSNFATLKRQHEGKVCNGICSGRLIPAGNMAANHKLKVWGYCFIHAEAVRRPELRIR